MTSLPVPVRAGLALLLLAAGVALLRLGQPSPVLLGLAALWLSMLLGLSFRRSRNTGTDVASSG